MLSLVKKMAKDQEEEDKEKQEHRLLSVLLPSLYLFPIKAGGTATASRTAPIMALFSAERRGPQWKHGYWRGQALSSLSLPPCPLLAVLAIVLFLMALSGYLGYRAKVQHTADAARLVLLVFPVALLFAARSLFVDGRFVFRLPRGERQAFHRAGSSPWGVAALVVLLLVMVAYQSSFHSQWFRPLWRSSV